ncbi:MAG: M56 family metallopeptidase [Gemmatimonadota bacterium]|nr:M56 family metallopeptidase [Gemmatimonadota bacterium]
MTSNFLAMLGGSAGSNIPMAMLLAKATIILLLALAMTIVMQRASAGARHLVWLVTVAALLLVPALTAWAPLPVRVLPAVRSIAEKASPFYGSKHEVIGNLKSDEPYKNGAVTAPSAPQEPTPSTNALSSMISGSTLRNGISMLFLIWVAVMLVIATSLGYATLVVRRIVHRARPLDSTDWLNPLWEVSDRLELEEPPRLLRSEDAKMPFACGLFQATIVLPAECDNWSLDRRRAVLLHELAHVRRHDLIGHTLGRLACAVYWFHPLVWTAAKQLRSESERACDDLALACGARAADYAEHLLDIVTSVRRDATPSVALAMARRKEFEGRMLAILDPELRHSSPSRRQSATLIGSVALISIVVGAAAPAPRASIEAHQSASLKSTEVQSSPTPVTKGYPDSYEIIGGSKTHTNTQTVMSEAEHKATSISEHTSTSMSARSSTWIDQGAAAAAATASATATATPEGLLRVLKRGMSKGSDERPALLAKILSTDTSPTLRRIAAWGLAEYADSQVAADALASALRHDANADVREMAAWALGDANKSSTAVEALSAALRGDASAQVRALSAWALGNVGDRSSTDVLVAALSDASPEVRKRALWAIGNSGPKQAPRAVIALLSDRDPEVRELAAWVLFEIEDPTAIPALEAALRAEKNNKNLQIAYIKALAATGEKSVDALKSLLESPDHEIKSIAVRALAGGNATGPWPWPWPEPRPSP